MKLKEKDHYGQDGSTEMFSVEIKSDTPDPNSVAMSRRLAFIDDDFVFDDYDGCSNLHDNFMRGMGYGGNYEWLSYRECYEKMLNIGAGLLKLGVKPGSYAAGIGRNCSQWFLLYHGSIFRGIPHIFVQDNTSEIEVIKRVKIVGDISTVVVSVTAGEIILKNIGDLPFIERVIIFTEFSIEKVGDLIDKFRALGIESLSFEELEELGKKFPAELIKPSEDDIAVVLFTSGTTTEAMGVKIAHKNLMCSVYNCVYYSKQNFCVNISKKDHTMSYLPMSHVIEISTQLVIIHCGGSIGFYSGIMDNFLKDISQIRPTVFVSVPRFYNMIYREISSAIAQKSGLSSFLFKKAYICGLKSNGEKPGLWRYMLERMVFSRVRSILGGRIRLFISGSSSVDNDVRKFFSVCFSCPFIETYGLTETCGAITMSLGIKKTEGTVGPPCCGVFIKLTNAQPLRSYVESGTYAKGEICVKGNMICNSYYTTDPEGCPFRLDSDGWFHTGDIGYWTENGLLKIVDRKVNIIPLKGGTVILSESIEDTVSNPYRFHNSSSSSLLTFQNSYKFNVSLLVGAYICYARPGGPFAVGVAFLSNEALVYAANTHKMVFKTLEEALENQSFRSVIKSALDEFISKSGRIPSLVCKHIYFESRNIKDLDILTASYKIKRHVVHRIYKHIFDSMYEEYDNNTEVSSSIEKTEQYVKTKDIKGSGELTDSAPWV